ncbi:dihydrolipoyl dehydrogenase [Mycobacterium botniense]|nr:dihydrolipoyl dehydrogenase [Mycobacterium botniense]
MTEPEKVDTITLGAGGAAYPAAFALARAGQQVVMVDPKGVMSGNCLAEGCVPSKAVYEVAELYRRVTAAPMSRALGALTGPPDYAQVVAWKDQVQKDRYRQHDGELQAASANLRLVPGTGRLIDSHTVEVNTTGSAKRFQAAQIIIASGADVFVPPIPGAQLCVTSRDLFALEPTVTSLPARLAVIGGGYVGLEVACMLRALGSQVTVIEALPGLLAGMDPDFVTLLAAGIDPTISIQLSASVTAVTKGDGGGFTVHYRIGDADSTVDADLVLMAVGRRPVIPDGATELGLPRAGHGLAVDVSMQVPGYPHLYAPGDVNGRSMLFHSAVRQSLVAAHNILAGNRVVDRMDFDSVPATIFTAPQGAYVGLTRAKAAEQARQVVEAAYPMADDSRAQILGDTYGEIRLFCDAQSLRLVGGWVVGADAAQLIGQIGESVAAGLTAYDLARFADQHPTAAEGIGKAARTLVG